MLFEHLRHNAGRIVHLGLTAWAKARLLGVARERTNPGNRRPGQDIAGHVVGALAELILYDAVRWMPGGAEPLLAMGRAMYNPGGGRAQDGPDLAFLDESTNWWHAIDAKSYDCDRKKRFFAVNAKKHAELAPLNCHYFCVLAPPNARTALIAELVPHHHVYDWPCFQLGDYKDPSHNLEIPDFIARYCTGLPSLDSLRRRRYDESEVRACALDRNVQTELLDMVPGLSPQEVCDAAAA